MTDIKVAILEKDGVELGVVTEYDAQQLFDEFEIGRSCFTKYDCGEVFTDRVFNCYDNIGGTDVTTTSTVLFDTTSTESDTRAFTLSSGEITVDIADNYWVAFDLSTDVTNTSRSVSRGWLEIDSGSGFSPIEGTETFIYNRTSASGKATGSGSTLIELEISDKVRIRAERYSGSGTIVTIANGSRLSIRPVKPKEDIDMLEIDCGDVGEDTTFCTYDCGEI